MELSKSKLEEVEYYEQDVEQGHDMGGIPYFKDIIVLHFGEWEKKWKLFGFTVRSETIRDRSKTYKFERIRQPQGDDTYKFKKSPGFKTIISQLRSHFKDELVEFHRELKNHELSYMID